MLNKYGRVVGSVLLLGLLFLTMAPMWVGAAPKPQAVGQELLRNPGFEGSCGGGWCANNWTRDTFTGAVYGEIFTPEGWVTYWSEGTNPVDGRPYGRPECKVIPNADPFLGPPARVRSGMYAIMQFGFFRSIDSGVYQTVTGLTPGATVRFSAYAHAWACDDDEHSAYSCADAYQTLFRVGIDPNGGTNPWSPSIVWASGYSYDEFRLIGPVEAQVGQNGNVTVFIRGTTKWPVKHNDIYIDDASLVYTTPPATATNTPLPAPPTYTPGPSPTPRATPTPRPDGAIVHVVQPGDTLFGISLMYNVPMEQIQQLNAGSIGPNNLISVDQALVISIPSAPPTAVPVAPTQAPADAASPTPAQVAEGGDTGTICVLAFNDRNGDSFCQQDTEELLANVSFSLGDAAGLRGQYTTDGLSEPYCFSALAPGMYRVTMQPPDGYAVSGPAYASVGLTAGATLDVALGAQRSEGAGGDTTDPEDEDQGGASQGAGALTWIARIGGILLLVVAIAVALLFFLTRRAA
ncbi:MAG: LysM peptidoglycan-binding domain-containing protein [Anaerolineae bacterium]|nr:LysM peptidoglycan-binding domain-containing protein [Anaerolineae bacterium]